MEGAVEEDRDLFDGTRDRIEEMGEALKVLMDWKKKVEEDGCDKCVSRERKGKYVPNRETANPGNNVAEDRRPAVPRVVHLVKNKEEEETPKYKKEVGSFKGEEVKEGWATVARKANKSGQTQRVGKAERKKVSKKMEVVRRDVAPERERQLSMRFNKNRRNRELNIPEKVTPEIVRGTLNKTLKSLNIDAYFAKVGLSRWGDIEMTLARTRAEDLVIAGDAMKQAMINELGFKDNFYFERDIKKVKVYIASVPLKKGGNGADWDAEDWQGESAFHNMVNDLENSNPGIQVCGRPSWVGKFSIMKSRK